METLLACVSPGTDLRQEKKVLYKKMDVIMPLFFVMLANMDDRVEMEVFGREHEAFLRKPTDRTAKL